MVLSDSALLVVHCNISPEAAKKKAFDKLLEANGIARLPLTESYRARDKGGAMPSAAENGSNLNVNGGFQSPPAGGAKKDSSDVLAQLPQATQDAHVGPVPGRNKQNGQAAAAQQITVEATQAQIAATLAGLAAQPKVFLSFHVEPKRYDSLYRNNVAYVQKGFDDSDRPRQEVEKFSGGDSFTTPQDKAGGFGQPPIPQAEPKKQLASKSDVQADKSIEVSPSKAPAAAGKQSQQKRPSSDLSKKSSPKDVANQNFWSIQHQQPQQSLAGLPPGKQRVLFVLHVVPGDPEPVAASRMQTEEKTDPELKPAGPVVPPTAVEPPANPPPAKPADPRP
jgi:hypothetical protein